MPVPFRGIAAKRGRRATRRELALASTSSLVRFVEGTVVGGGAVTSTVRFSGAENSLQVPLAQCSCVHLDHLRKSHVSEGCFIEDIELERSAGALATCPRR